MAGQALSRHRMPDIAGLPFILKEMFCLAFFDVFLDFACCNFANAFIVCVTTPEVSFWVAFSEARKRFVHEFCRLTFQQSYRIAYTHVDWQINKQVHMLWLHTANSMIFQQFFSAACNIACSQSNLIDSLRRLLYLYFVHHSK